jgi:LCP family protein required for cell wall assembly
MKIMKRSRSSVDGFIPRRSGTPLGRPQGGEDTPQPQHGLRSPSERPVRPDGTGTLERSKTLGLARTDIDESLKQIDDSKPIEEKKRRKWRLGRPRSKRKVIKWIVIAIVVIGLLIGGWLAYKAFSNANSVFKGGLLGLVQKKPLKQDANGRSNVLIFGTSEDSADHNANGGAGGPLLTDSIMVLSVNQEKKDAYMVSIPRDLWVKFDEPCSVGWQEKINSVYQCASNFGENPEAGAKALQKKVGEILGLDIQYYGQVDYSVVTKSVDAVGGVDVVIESNPPGMGILDRNFDWKCNYQCYYVKYDDGQKVHLDGEHALALSRARNASGGYGLAGGNFDREKNQQKILKAVREKALSVGTLTNIGRVTELLDAMGSSLKTNVDKSEVQTIMSLATDIPADAIASLTLNDPEAPLVKNGNVGSASVVLPIAGMFEYGQIKAYIAKASSNDPAIKEGATIDVLNGSGVAGAAQNEANWLEGQGFTVGQIGNAPGDSYPTAKIYQRTQSMSGTKTKLESLYGVKAETEVPATITGTADFVVIISKSNPAR